MRLGRSYSQYDLHRPAVVFSPAPATQQQQTVTTSFTVAVSRRWGQQRVFPRQGWVGGQIAKSDGSFFGGAANRLIGVWPPELLAVPPVVTTVAVHTIRTRPRHTVGAVYGPVIVFAPPLAAPISVTAVALHAARPRRTIWVVRPPTAVLRVGPLAGSLAMLTRLRPRKPFSVLWGPVVISVPSPVLQPIQVTSVATRPARRRPRSFLPLPAPATSTFTASPVAVALSRSRPHRPSHTLAPLIFYPQTSAVRVSLARTRPRPTRRFLTPLIFYPATSVIRTPFVRTRPRPTTKRLAYVVYPQVTPVTETEVAVRTVVDDRRRRQPRSRLQPPFFYPQTSTVSTHLVRARPRPTTRALGPLIFYPQTSELQVALAHTRPRHTTHTGLSYVVYPATSTIRVALVRTRPRATRRVLTAVFYPQITPISEAEVAVKTVVDDRRRRGTHTRLAPPAILPATSTIRATLTRIRPRRTHVFLFPPSLAPPPVVTTLAIHTVRTRPRHTIARFTPPVVEPYIRPPDRRLELPALLVRTRPRPTRHVVTAVSYSAKSSIAVHLVRTRPRPTRRFLSFVTFRTAGSVAVHLTTTRPRPIHSALRPPTALRGFGPPAEVEVAVKTPLERIRQAPHSRLAPPIFYRATSTIRTLRVVTRPRRTSYVLGAPRVAPATSQIRATLVLTRPRPTVALLAPPTAVHEFVPAALLRSETRTRPRHTTSRLSPPAVVTPFVEPLVTTLATHTVRIRPPQTRPLLRPPGPPCAFGSGAVTDYPTNDGSTISDTPTNPAGTIADRPAETGGSIISGSEAQTGGTVSDYPSASGTITDRSSG